jgi:hypothetical protein
VFYLLYISCLQFLLTLYLMLTVLTFSISHAYSSYLLYISCLQFLLTLYLMLTVLTYSISHAYSSYFLYISCLQFLLTCRQILLEFKDTKGIIKISKSRRRHVCTIVITNAIYSINIVYTKKKTTQ